MSTKLKAQRAGVGQAAVVKRINRRLASDEKLKSELHTLTERALVALDAAEAIREDFDERDDLVGYVRRAVIALGHAELSDEHRTNKAIHNYTAPSRELLNTIREAVSRTNRRGKQMTMTLKEEKGEAPFNFNHEVGMSEEFGRFYYLGTDTTTSAAISRTLKQLPEDIAVWVIYQCAFASVGGEICGSMVNLTSDLFTMNQVSHLILLDEDAMQTADAMYIVAHELAHARLNHSGEGCEQYEEAADALAAEWGFNRNKKEA